VVVVVHGTALAPVDQARGGRVGPVGERLGDEPDPCCLRRILDRRARQPQYGERRIEVRHGAHERPSLHRIVGGGVVQRAMRFEVAHAGAGSAGEPVERPELVEHVRAQVLLTDVHAPAAEAGEIPVRDLGPDGHAALGGAGADPRHGRRVTGVEPARDVGAGDHLEQGVVVGQRPGAEALPEVGVEVDPHMWSLGGPGGVRLRRYGKVCLT
jgi:hypothetical protein